MAEGDEPLSDRWMRGIKNNPIVAGMIVIGALIAIASPILSMVSKLTGGAKAEAPASATPTSGGLHRARTDNLEADRDSVLVPVRNALRENEALYEKLSSPLYNEPGWGIQESYYERVRRDGAERHELMRGMIDRLVQTNEEIMEKLDGYMGRAKTTAFKEQEAEFRKHARLYQARWTGMKAAALSGEEQPIAEPSFPRDFPSSLEAEIAAVEKMIAGDPRP